MIMEEGSQRGYWKCFVVHEKRKEGEVLVVEDINSGFGTCVLK
jgi:hypothetical protein